MTDETIVDRVARTIAERELTLGTIECGVNGLISRRLFETDDGPAVLGNSLVLDDADIAVGLLDLPRPQLKKAGVYSAKAARAAAREGGAFLGEPLCMVAWGPTPESEPPQTVFLALDVTGDVQTETLQVDLQDEDDQRRLVERAFEMLDRALT
jgi:nicotinamide mononucleotide (NMN) deamidase PncC